MGPGLNVLLQAMSMQEAQMLLRGLNSLPHGEVRGLFDKIWQQMRDAEMAAMQKVKAAEEEAAIELVQPTVEG